MISKGELRDWEKARKGLWFAFARYGEVIDAFIPAKKSKTGFIDSRDTLTKTRLKRVLGHVDEEALMKLEKYLIGTMATVCSTSQVEDRLQAWGLNDVIVKYMGGCRFLIDIKDQELKRKLQLQDWAVLKEIFCEVETWNELFHLPERNAWIQITCVPLHCWNPTAFKGIHRGRINEVIEIEAGRDCFLVQVNELGLTFHLKQSIVPLQSKAKMIVDHSPESLLESSSVPDQSSGSTNKSRSNCIGEDEVAKAICLEKGSLVVKNVSELNAGRSLGEKIFLGNIQSEEVQPLNQMKNSISVQASNEAVRSVLNVTSIEACEPSIQVDRPMVRWVDVVARHMQEQMSPGDKAANKVMDRGGMGISLPATIENTEGVDEVSFSDGEGATRRSGKSKDTNSERAISRVGSNFELPEFHNMFKASRIRKKIFGSLFDIQDKGLSDADKRKRDRVRKRLKKKGKLEETTELEGYSVTDSDMRARRNLLLAEATKTLEVGKLVGIEFIGDENEVVQDLILIAEKEQDNREKV
ncbi:hypothetical protein V6N13_061943 [Hibiscus sabdariffa]